MDCHFEQRVTNKEMDNAFALLNKYVKSSNNEEELALINTGGNTYVLGLRKKGGGAYSTIGSHLSKKEMVQTLWNYTAILSQVKFGDLKFK